MNIPLGNTGHRDESLHHFGHHLTEFCPLMELRALDRLAYSPAKNAQIWCVTPKAAFLLALKKY
jgi:hypothetical protein